jgi:CRISPR-associated protein Cas2
MRKEFLVSYDVNTQDKEGRRRLRKVAKTCEGYGQRVQFSVFECKVADVDFERFRDRLIRIIKPDADSLRIYHLRGSRESYLEHFGRDQYVDFEEPLIV